MAEGKKQRCNEGGGQLGSAGACPGNQSPLLVNIWGCDHAGWSLVPVLYDIACAGGCLQQTMALVNNNSAKTQS